MKYIKKFKELKISDVPLVGGKNASLGQMIAELSRKHIKIPGGFAITAQAYWDFIDHNDLRDKIATLLSDLKDYKDIKKFLQNHGFREIGKSDVSKRFANALFMR